MHKYTLIFAIFAFGLFACERAALDDCRAELSACDADRAELEQTLGSREGQLNDQLEARVLAERRMEAYRDVAERFRRVQWSFDPGELAVMVRDGNLVIQLPNRILFDSGKAVIKANGHHAIKQVASIMKTIPDRKFLIAGHTDDIPVLKKTKAFKSNWELSAMRAITVVRALQEQGVKGKRLGAAGYGPHVPLAKNDTERNRRRNRRTEIIMIPQAAEIVPLPQYIGDEEL